MSSFKPCRFVDIVVVEIAVVHHTCEMCECGSSDQERVHRFWLSISTTRLWEYKHLSWACPDRYLQKGLAQRGCKLEMLFWQITDEWEDQISRDVASQPAQEVLIISLSNLHPKNERESPRCRQESSRTRTIQQSRENGEKFYHCK